MTNIIINVELLNVKLDERIYILDISSSIDLYNI